MNRPVIIACVGAVDDEPLGLLTWNLAGVVADEGQTVLVLDLTESGALTRLVLDDADRRELEWQAQVAGVRAWLMNALPRDAAREVDRDLWLLPATPAAGDGIGYAPAEQLRLGLETLIEEVDAAAVLLATGRRHRAQLWPLLGLADRVVVAARSSHEGIQQLRRLGQELRGRVPMQEDDTGYLELNGADPATAVVRDLAPADWAKALPAVYRQEVLGRPEEFGVEIVNDPLCIGRLLHHPGLMDVSRTSHRPVSRLSAADGLDPLLAKAARRQSTLLRSMAARLSLTETPPGPQTAQRPVRSGSPTQWHRYWLPATGVDPQSVIAGGYLIEPGSPEGRYRADALFDRSDLDTYRCSILLGEPGIGKTTELESWGVPGAVHLVYGAEIDERADLGAELDQWTGDPPLHIDGLDESGLFRQSPRRFFRMLGEAVKRATTPTLRLTCRTAYWTSSIEQMFARSVPARLFEEPSHPAFVLAPLTRADVRAYAAERIDDAEQWLARIDALRLGPSAAHPFSLTRLYLPEGQPPAALDSTPWDLQERAALALCRSPAHDQHDHPPRQLSSGERLDVSSFIAFARVMTARTTFSTSPGPGPGLSADDLTDAGLYDLSDIREALDCPLFAGGGDRRRFVHESFADFLAARYAAASLEPKATWDAACNRRGRIPEALFEMISWLGQRVGWIEDRLHREEPLRVLERAPFLDQNARRALLARLVRRHRGGQLSLAVQYRALLNLAGPGMEVEVGALLDDRDDQLVEAAAYIAQYSGYSSLAPRLASIALDSDRSHRSRTSALDALADIDGDFDRAALRTLLPDPDGEDIPGAGRYSEDIVAAALPILWPEYISLEELLGHLRPPRGLGRWRYDRHRLVDSFTPEQLPLVVDWALNDLDRRGPRSDLERFTDSVARRCWEFLRPGAILTALSRAIQSRGNSLQIDWSGDEARRQMVLRHILSEPAGLRWGWRRLYPLGLLRPEDAPFILGSGEDADGDDKVRWGEMLRQIFRRPEHDDLIDRARALPGFSAYIEAYERTIAGRLDPGPYVHRHKERIAQRRRWRARSKRADSPTVEVALETIEVDADHGWLLLDIAMETRLGSWWSLDGHALEALTAEQGERLLSFAGAEIQRDPSDGSHDLDRRTLRAWEVLSTCAPERLASVSAERWRAWLPLLMARPTQMTSQLHRLAQRHAPGAWCQAWLDRYRAAICARTDGDLELRRLLGLAANVYTATLETAAVELLDEPSLPLLERAPLLCLLLPKRVQAARQWAEAHFDETRIAFELLRDDPDGVWPRVWSRLGDDAAWGRRLWLDGGVLGRDFAFTDSLPPEARAELAWWLLQHFEPTQVPEGVAYSMTPADWLHSEAARLIQTMVQTGEVDGLRRLVELDPSPHMADRLTRAERNADARDWEPFAPADLETLIRPPRTSTELADAVLRALELIQWELIDGAHAETASFWDRQGPRGRREDEKRRPKSEDELSYWLRNRLEERLPRSARSTVDRETDIASGQRRADIRVGLATGRSPMTVIIEAKGCWHREVISSVQDQLAVEYLARMPDASGVYVVWWFDSANWTDDTDSRKRKVRSDYRDNPDHLADVLRRKARAVAQNTGRDVRSVVLRVSKSPPALEDEQ